MDSITEGSIEEKRSPVFWVTLGVAALALAFGTIIYLTQSQKQKITPTVEGAMREGAEFDAAAKNIVVEWDTEHTAESITAMGTIQMSIRGMIRNFSGRTLTGLEVGCAVVDFGGATVKEKSFAVIPNKQPTLDNNKTAEFVMVIDGFNKNDDRSNIKCRPVAIKY